MEAASLSAFNLQQGSMFLAQGLCCGGTSVMDLPLPLAPKILITIRGVGMPEVG